jgi:hypothetical protein
MKEVIRIGEVVKESEKAVEFTHYQSGTNGWCETIAQPSKMNKVVFLGQCCYDGDMFAAYGISGTINIYKGHLNSGKY